MSRRVYVIEDVETIWLSPEAATEYRLSQAERVSLNRAYVNRWLALYAPENRNPN